MPQTSGRVLVVDDDLGRLSAVSEALRAKGHEVHAFGGGAEARECLAGTGVDVVIATAAVAFELDEARRETTRGASWILRVDPQARPPQRGMFIASVPVDASPRAVAETVAAAMMMRRPKRHTRPSISPATREPPPVSKRLPELPDRPPLFKPAPRAPVRSTPRESVRPMAPARSTPGELPASSSAATSSAPGSSSASRFGATASPDPRREPALGPDDLEISEDGEEITERDAPVAPPAEVAPKKRVGVIARDAKIVRRLCEFFEEAGLAARGFTSARTAVDIASGHCFDALVMEEQLDDLEAGALVERIALKLGARAPRMLVLARAGSTLAEPAITTIIRSPATPEAILEALVSAMDAPAPKPPEAADGGDDSHDDGDITRATEDAVSPG